MPPGAPSSCPGNAKRPASVRRALLGHATRAGMSSSAGLQPPSKQGASPSGLTGRHGVSTPPPDPLSLLLCGPHPSAGAWGLGPACVTGSSLSPSMLSCPGNWDVHAFLSPSVGLSPLVWDTCKLSACLVAPMAPACHFPTSSEAGFSPAPRKAQVLDWSPCHSHCALDPSSHPCYQAKPHSRPLRASQAPLGTCCVMWGRLLTFSGPQFSQLPVWWHGKGPALGVGLKFSSTTPPS